jgi:PhoH-like ATPase
MKKTYVFDTSAILSDYKCIYEYKRNDIVIPFKVLEEIDAQKKRQDGVGFNARMIIRELDLLRAKGNIYRGVRIDKGKGLLSIRGYDKNLLPDEYKLSSADNEIIGTAITERKKNFSRQVVMVTKDIHMRVKCDTLELPCEDYDRDKIHGNDESYSGTIEYEIEDKLIDYFYEGQEVYLDEKEIKLYPHQCILFKSSHNAKKTALAKFLSYDKPIKKLPENKRKMWGVKSKNKEQVFAASLLMDQDIPIVSLIGPAGSGKTLLAIAAGLEQTLAEGRYNKLVISRPVLPVGKDIGFLPGTVEEKMNPWLAPIRDNLEFLMSYSYSKRDTHETLDTYIQSGVIEVEALTYIRGRSIANAYIIIDESQNLTAHELKTIITRVGENTKIVLTGDVEQIDNLYVDRQSNGLSYAIEKFKKHDLAAHLTLKKGERSAVATLASQIL